MSGTFNQTLEGGSGNDIIGGGVGNDWIFGGDGRDTLAGLAGNDSIFGGNDNDFIDGGAEADTLRGGDGDDLVQGGTGNDSIDGGLGNDTLSGGIGNDSLFGGDGVDSLVGGDGNDWLDFGAGNDVFSYLDGDNFGNETLLGALGNNTLILGRAWNAGVDQGGFNTYSREDGSILYAQGWTVVMFDTLIENQGNVSLLRHFDGGAFVQVGTTRYDITIGGVQQRVGTAGSEWQMLAAENVGGVNKILWRNNPTGDVAVWRLNSDWQWTSSEPGLIRVNSVQGGALETAFGVDADRSGGIGIQGTAVESQGSGHSLESIADGGYNDMEAGFNQPVALLGSSTDVQSDPLEW
jgi:hypothetical protein